MAPRHSSSRLLRRRLRRTLHYGASSRMEQLSLPLSEVAVDYFDRHSPFDSLPMHFATTLSREGCVDPCTLLVALVYLDRMRLADREHFESADPADLYLASLIVASKYLHDDGNDDFVYNDEWAASASTTLKHVNEQEIRLLTRLNWNVAVSSDQFDAVLRSVESRVAGKAIATRGFATYTDLRVLCRQLLETDFLWHQFLQPLLALFGLASLAYTAAVVTLFSASVRLDCGLSSCTPVCDQSSTTIQLLPIAHSTIGSFDSTFAVFSACPENLLNAADIGGALFSTNEHRQRDVIQQRNQPVTGVFTKKMIIMESSISKTTAEKSRERHRSSYNLHAEEAILCSRNLTSNLQAPIIAN